MNSAPARRPRRTRMLAVALGAALAMGAAALPAAPAIATPIGTTYYVDCSVAASGNGTAAATPWNSLAHPNRHGAFQPGDHILLKRGSTCKGSLHPQGSGTRSAPIVLGAYGKGALPTINGNTVDQSGTVSLRNQAYFTIQDLHVTNHGTAKEVKQFRSGVLIRNDGAGRLASVTVQRLKIDSVVSNLAFYWQDPRDFGGISVITRPQAGVKSGFDGLKILHNTISRVGRTGIMVSNQSSNATDTKPRIGYNRITRARGDSIVLRNAANARIDHNISANGADFWPCKQCGQISPATANAGIWPSNTKNAVIENNEVYGEHQLGGDGQGIDVDVSAMNTVVQDNYVHDNEGGGILLCGSNDTSVRFNVLENNQRGAFTFIGSIPATKTRIYNNTVYISMKNGADVVHLQGNKGGRSISFFNNVIYNMGWGFYHWPAAYTSSHNTVVGTHGIGEPRGNATIFDTKILRNPGNGGVGFKTLSGYHPSSPKDDPRGIAIPASVTKDFFGNTINPKSPPRGAAIK